MKLLFSPILTIFILLTTFYSISQISEGSNTLACPSAQTFFDSGGAGGNYSFDEHNVYTICPAIPPGMPGGYYVSVTFTSFTMADVYDHMVVFNGSGGNAEMISDFITMGTMEHSGTPGTITSSSDDGCLTFVFNSSGNLVGGNAAGWVASAGCSLTPGNNAANISAFCDEQNCTPCARTICGDGTYTWTGDDTQTEELNAATAGCLSPYLGEMCNVWYFINPASSGTVTLGIISNGGQDQDFAVYQGFGDELNCPLYSGAAPMLCNFAAMSMVGTGFDSALDTDMTAGTWYEPSITVSPTDLANDVFYMVLINTYNSGGSCPQTDVELTFGGTALLDCTPVVLPVELALLTGIPKETSNYIEWITYSEQNNDYFQLEKSIDGITWEDVGNRVPGAGTSSDSHYYYQIDERPETDICYYRLKQFDFNGEDKLSKIIIIKRNMTFDDMISEPYPNPSSEYFDFQYSGILLNSNLTLELLDLNGKLVSTKTYFEPKKGQTLTFPLENIPKGIYMSRFSQGELITTRRITIIQ